MSKDYRLGDPITSPGLPPWDGTGIPLPVNENGWPELPDEDRLRIVSPTEGETVQGDVTVSGDNAAPGTTVTLYIDGGDIGMGTGTTNSDGTWSIGPATLDAGAHTLVVKTELQASLPRSITVAAAGPATVWLTSEILPAAGYATDTFTDTINAAISGGTPVPGTTTLTCPNQGDVVVGTVQNGGGLFDMVIDTSVLEPGNMLTITATFVPDDPASYVVGGQAGDSIDLYPPAAEAAYDPGEHTVAEVQAYLADHPDQTDDVLAAERAGKNRSTLTGGA